MPKINIKLNLLKNGIAQFLSKILLSIEHLALVPIYLSVWGGAYYGEWLTLTIVPSILLLSEVGLATAAANTFVVRYSGGNRQGAAFVLKVGKILTALTICVVLVAGIAFLVAFQSSDIFVSGLIPLDQSATIFMLLLASGSVGFVGQLHSGHFILARRAALGNNVNNVFSIVRMLSISVVLLLTGDPVVVAGVVFSLSVSNNLIIVLLARHLLKGDDQCVTDQTARSVEQWWPTARIILKKGLSFFTIGSIWQVILFQGITLVVRIAMGPESVALFNTLRMLSRSVNQVISMIYATIFPELQAELCSGNIDRGGKLFRLAIGSSALLGMSGFFVLAVFGVPFYKFWTHSELSVPILAWFILIAGIPFNSLWWTMSMVFRAVNQPEKVAHILLPCAVAAVGLTWLLIGQFGVYAPITASLLFDVAVLLLILPPVSKIVNCSPASLLLDSFSEVVKALRTVWHMVKSAGLN